MPPSGGGGAPKLEKLCRIVNVCAQVNIPRQKTLKAADIQGIRLSRGQHELFHWVIILPEIITPVKFVIMLELDRLISIRGRAGVVEMFFQESGAVVLRAANKSRLVAAKSPTPESRAGSGRARFQGRPPEGPELFDVRGLLLPGHLFGQGGITLGQLLEAGIGMDSCDNGLGLIGSDALAVVFAVLPPLQEEVGALGEGLACASDAKGLLADMAADHLVDASHFFENAGTFLLDMKA